MTDRKQDNRWVLIAVAAAVVLFSWTLNFDLVWDDIPLVRNAERIGSERGIAGLWTSEFAVGDVTTDYYRPLVLSSLWFDSLFPGSQPVIYHLTNVLLHSLNVLLVFVLMTSLSLPPAGAFAGSLLFAVHPVHVEPIAFVAGRTDLLATVFVLLSVIFWAREPRVEKGRRLLFMWLSLGAFMMACFAKEVAYPLPLLLLAGHSLRVRGRLEGDGVSGNNPGKWLLGWAGVLGIVFALRFAVLGTEMVGVAWGSEAGSGSFSGGPMVSAGIWATYSRLLLFPWPLKPFYSLANTGFTPLSILAAVALPLLCVAPLRGRGNRGWGLFSLAWILVFLIPVLGIFDLGVSVLGERYLYLPSVGLCLVAGLLTTRLVQNGRVPKAYLIFGSAVIVALSAQALQYSGVWRDDVHLFSYLIRVHPDVAVGHYNLGNAHYMRGLPRKAEMNYRKTISIDPEHVKAHFNLALVYKEAGETDKAIEVYTRLAGIVPENGQVHNLLAWLYYKNGQKEEAAREFGKASALLPDLPELSYNRGNALADLGRHEEAIGSFLRALELKPEYYQALFNMGNSYAQLGSFRQAETAYLKAIDVSPELVQAYLNLSGIFYHENRYALSASILEKAAGIFPSDLKVRYNLARSYLAKGDRESAIPHLDYLRKADPKAADRALFLLREEFEVFMTTTDSPKKLGR